jgi:hypothetical protein
MPFFLAPQGLARTASVNTRHGREQLSLANNPLAEDNNRPRTYDSNNPMRTFFGDAVGPWAYGGWGRGRMVAP